MTLFGFLVLGMYRFVVLVVLYTGDYFTGEAFRCGTDFVFNVTVEPCFFIILSFGCDI